MKRSKVAAWLGATAVLGTGIGFSWWAHEPARARSADRRAAGIEPERDRAGERIAVAAAGPGSDEARSRGHGDEPLRRVSAAGNPLPVMSSLPLPSRVPPGPWPETGGDRPQESVPLSSTPRIPTAIPRAPDKTLPRAISGDGRDSTDGTNGSDSSEED
jgi:hypothetical protein